MKLNINRKKLRFGGISVALTAFVIAAVVLLNVLFYSLATNFRWYADMTSEALFTLSDECKTLINDAILGENGVNAERAKYNQTNGLKPGDKDYKEEAKVTLYFCDDPDNLTASYYMRYIYNTALELESEFDFIEIGYYNVIYKPSEVLQYQKTGYQVTSQSIIVESGTEYRVFDVSSMYKTDDNGNFWAYNGEKKLAGAILAVTAADQPVAYITTSHSEKYFDTALMDLLEDAGYEIRIEGSEYLDGNGNTQTVPTLSDKKVNPLDDEDVRLVVVYNPRNDFQTDGVNELDRLNRFLEEDNSMMVFMGPTSPVLGDFEEWLADKWGIVFDRYKAENGSVYSYMINDTSASLDSAGYAVKADYVTGGGLGASIYSKMLDNGISPSVYFENAMSISYSGGFKHSHVTNDDDKSKDYWFGSSWVDGVTKNIFDVFTAGLSATAIANGTTVATGSSESLGSDSMFIFRDVDGKTYYLNDEKNKILDEDGNELFYNENNNLVTAAGTELKISGGRIVAVGNVDPDSYGVIVNTVIEFNGEKYSLSENGTAIVDASGKVLGSEVVDGVTRFKTPAGSVFTIETVAGKPSIKVLESAKNTSNPFRLMTISHRPRSEQETNYTTAEFDSYVLACGSLEFATEKYLSSAVYGNSDVLLSATTLMGREVVPVGLDFKPFASFEISDITDAEANRYTLLLTILPPIVILGVGIVVLVRRKYS